MLGPVLQMKLILKNFRENLLHCMPSCSDFSDEVMTDWHIFAWLVPKKVFAWNLLCNDHKRCVAACLSFGKMCHLPLVSGVGLFGCLIAGVSQPKRFNGQWTTRKCLPKRWIASSKKNCRINRFCFLKNQLSRRSFIYPEKCRAPPK